MKIIKRIGVIAAVGALAWAATVSTASADTWAWHGSDYAVTSYYDHNLAACDKETDGHGVTAYGTFWHPQNGSMTLTVTDGGDEGCGGATTGGYKIDKIKICENTVGCSSWQDVT
ncbi:hypothetical protein E1292_07615 [Nonomuraea deserti]|uniref:Uncharacterized protein n=1 Tax=Nonomuraea deserti TaxID=1848322 RepID=A0A4R4VY37_9ACTN|nr:hypothetical protein [Nonomuraea deserti]TDD10371.1 hypothetical protein E1292_07615 [Nonomuraea deserti]